MKKKWTKKALALSVFLFILWWMLGTGATIAWFSDTDTVRNEFRIGLLDLDVFYKNNKMTQYESLEGMTEAFDDEALYEPGYTQVVYLKIKNNGNVDFKYKVAVTVDDFNIGENAWGKPIYLPEYLRYGVVFAKDEAELQNLVNDRVKVKSHATNIWGALGTWSEKSPYTFKANGEDQYVALIVYMPEEVDNRANNRGPIQPTVKLGITVFAQQENAPMNN